MNDHALPSDIPDAPANGQPKNITNTASPVSLTLGDVEMRREEIARAILRSDPSARTSVAAMVALFRDEIATALVAGKSWAAIATALSESGVAARADAVRMAYRRLPDRQHQSRPRALIRPVTTDQPVPAQRSSDSPRSADKAPDGPSIARRVR